MTATLDDRKLSSRGLFDDTSHRQTQLPLRVHTGGTVCHQLPFHVYVRISTSESYKFFLLLLFFNGSQLTLAGSLLQDTADYIRPISFSLRYKINDTDSGPVLDEGWPTTVKRSVRITVLHCVVACINEIVDMLCGFDLSLQIQFFKDCGEDDVCTTDLVLQARMDISGTRYGLPSVGLRVFLQNSRDV